VQRVNGRTGRTLWRRALRKVIINTSCYSRGHGCVLANPVLCGPHLLVAGADGGLYCFKAGTGERLWRLELGVPANSTPAIGTDAVYIATLDGSVHALVPPTS
jgi:outer membrane protein assembly factor BamB